MIFRQAFRHTADDIGVDPVCGREFSADDSAPAVENMDAVVAVYVGADDALSLHHAAGVDHAVFQVFCPDGALGPDHGPVIAQNAACDDHIAAGLDHRAIHHAVDDHRAAGLQNDPGRNIAEDGDVTREVILSVILRQIAFDHRMGLDVVVALLIKDVAVCICDEISILCYRGILASG